MSLYTIDEYGRAVVDSNGLFELWMQGIDESGLALIVDEEVAAFNRQCELHDKNDFKVEADQTPPIPHAERAKQWMIPDAYKAIDVQQWCLDRCSTDEERARVRHEMALFDFYGFLPVLQSLIHMVDVFREKNIVWGIGRGSSVASFVLFLIGVHKIHPLKFGLQIEDFLR